MIELGYTYGYLEGCWLCPVKPDVVPGLENLHFPICFFSFVKILFVISITKNNIYIFLFLATLPQSISVSRTVE